MKLIGFILILQILFFSSCVSANAIQLMEPEPQGLVSGAEQNAEELLVKAKESQITEGPQMKAKTKDLIQQLKNDFDPNPASRRLYDVDTMIRYLQAMTSYKDFTRDMKKLNTNSYELQQAQTFVYDVLKEFEEYAGIADNKKPIRPRVTVRNQNDFVRDERLQLLAQKYVEILKMRFKKPDILEVVTKFIDGLRLDMKKIQSLFLHKGKYIPYLQKALMSNLYSEDDVPSEENQSTSSEESYESDSNEDSNEDWARMDPPPQKVEGESNVHKDNAKITLKIDKEDLDALKSLGLKSLKLVLVNVPENNTTRSGQLAKNKDVTHIENDELNNQNIDILLANDMGKEKRTSESSKNLEHNKDLAQSYLRRNIEPKEATSKLGDSQTSARLQKSSKPALTKFAQVAAARGIPLFKDAVKQFDDFWMDPDIDIADLFDYYGKAFDSTPEESNEDDGPIDTSEGVIPQHWARSGTEDTDEGFTYV